MSRLQVWLLTALALLAFAGNSVLCRLALMDGLMDPAGFTLWRLGSGMLVLLLMVGLRRSAVHPTESRGIFSGTQPRQQMMGSLALFVYMAGFSWAYVQLTTGAGALVLFGSVQLTLMALARISGQRLKITEYLGALLAFLGLLYLLLPAWGTPTVFNFALMALAGMAWSYYTRLGQASDTPLATTTVYFIGTLPLVLLLVWFRFEPAAWSQQGVLLAITSGALTSAVGYAIWYWVLPALSTMQAGVLQLLVPLLAALGGVLFAAEALTMRMALAAVMILGGLWVVTRSRQARKPAAAAVRSAD